MTKRIVVIGAGNVASHIAPALEESGAGVVVQVYSRSLESAGRLASRLRSAAAINDVAAIVEDADVYLVSLVDDAIAPFVDSAVGRLKGDALWMHTSGSIGMEVLAPLSPHYGVFYPLQTFSKDVALDVAEVPLFIEGSTRDVAETIRSFASSLFKRVYDADSNTRRMMHIAAVFACNFTNYMWTLASDVLSVEGLPFDVLKPLLEETLRKACTVGPEAGQTGPAARGDRRVIDTHINLIDGEKKEIYRLLSECIISRHAPGEKS